jgi:hypothetical protein
MYRPPLSPRKYFWHSFLLEAESTPEPQSGRKNYVNENMNLKQQGKKDISVTTKFFVIPIIMWQTAAQFV